MTAEERIFSHRGMTLLSWALVVAGFVANEWVLLVHRGWMALGEILGWINTRVLPGLLFYLLVTPIGMVRRLMGKDPMGQLNRPDLKSYRVPRQPRSASHMTKQFQRESPGGNV